MKIEIFGKANCSWCDKAIELCSQKLFSYEYFDLANEYFLSELKSRLPSVRTVPQIWVNDEHIGGYEEFKVYVRSRYE